MAMRERSGRVRSHRLRTGTSGPPGRSPQEAALAELHEQIDSCRVCQTFAGPGFDKPIRLSRGDPSRVMIIGQGPGRQEVRQSRAFAGMSGRRLDSWLLACGAPPENPRSVVYTTAVIKCFCPAAAKFERMRVRCSKFLSRQMEILRPQLVVTLGERAFASAGFEGTAYTKALCKLYLTEEYMLFTPFGFHFALMPWPHPSGLNRWLNNGTNRDRLERSFDLVRPFLRGTS